MSPFANWNRSGEPLRFQFASEADGAIQGSPVGGVPADLLRSESDRYDPVQMLIDGDPAAIHRASPALPVDLQSDVVVLHRVVAIHHPLGLNGEDAIEIGARARDKG